MKMEYEIFTWVAVETSKRYSKANVYYKVKYSFSQVWSPTRNFRDDCA